MRSWRARARMAASTSFTVSADAGRAEPADRRNTATFRLRASSSRPSTSTVARKLTCDPGATFQPVAIKPSNGSDSVTGRKESVSSAAFQRYLLGAFCNGPPPKVEPHPASKTTKTPINVVLKRVILIAANLSSPVRTGKMSSRTPTVEQAIRRGIWGDHTVARVHHSGLRLFTEN